MSADVQQAVSHEPSGSGALRPKARLLRTLGSDLISSDKVALIELVKNSYDADASVVLIRFHGPLEEGTATAWTSPRYSAHGSTSRPTPRDDALAATEVGECSVRRVSVDSPRPGSVTR